VESITYNTEDWFVLRTKSKHEKQVALAISRLGFENLLPLFKSRRQWKERWADVSLPLFPGYVFCRFDRESWGHVMKLPGVVDVVRCGKKLAAVDEDQMRSLIIVQRTPAGQEPWSYVATGEKIRISAGPFAGVVGTLIEAKGQRRLVLSVDLIGRSVLVHLDADCVDPSVAWAAYSNSSRQSPSVVVAEQRGFGVSPFTAKI
jgi:transcription antitermination factor NusG